MSGYTRAELDLRRADLGIKLRDGGASVGYSRYVSDGLSDGQVASLYGGSPAGGAVDPGALGQVSGFLGDLGGGASGQGFGSLLGDLGIGAGARSGAASWRGVPFVVQGQDHRTGRRTAVHEYPFRDDVWVEDLGRAVRGKRVQGFLVGSNVAQQRAAMRRAAETAGPGELVLPTEGRITCSLVGYSDSEAWDEGRVVRLQFEFIEGGPPGVQKLPATARDTRAAVGRAADAAASASSRSWLQRVGDGLLGRNESFARAGYATAKGVVDQVKPYVSAATRLVGDASRVVGAVRGLAGDFGRFSFGRLSGLSGGLGAVEGALSGAIGRVQQVEGQVQRVIGTATQARATVQRAGEGLGRLAGLL